MDFALDGITIGNNNYINRDSQLRSEFNLYKNTNLYPLVRNGAVVFIGDSWTVGSGASDIGHRFSTLLANDLTMIELNYGTGASGFCIPDNTFLDQIEAANTDLSTKTNVRLVIVYGGVNDIRHINDYDITASKFWNAVENTMARAAEVFPYARIVLCYNSRMNQFTNTEFHYLQGAINRRIFRMNGGNVCAFGNTPNVISGQPEMYQNDYLHPTDSGHSTIAGYLANCLRGGNQNIQYYTSDLVLNSFAEHDIHIHFMRDNYMVTCTGGRITFPQPVTEATKIGELENEFVAPKFNFYVPCYFADAQVGSVGLTTAGNFYYLPDAAGTEATGVYIPAFSYYFGRYN